MIGRAPPLFTVILVAAQPTMRDRIRRNLRGRTGCAGEPLTNRAVVRGEIGGAQPDALAGAKNDDHPLGLVALHGPDAFAVVRELQDMLQLRVPRELRV